MGYQALPTTTSGSNNIAIGYMAGTGLTTGNSNIVIGASAGVLTATASNQLSIGNLIFGNGLTGTVAAPQGNLGIGTNNPTARLDIDGTFRVRNAGTPGI